MTVAYISEGELLAGTMRELHGSGAGACPEMGKPHLLLEK